MASVSVPYIVHDVDAAIVFYRQHLGFHEDMHPAPPFAMLARGDLRLVLSAPSTQGGGGQALPDGTVPQRHRCRRQTSPRRRPSGNPVELFEPTIAEARLASA
jgi:catechol 2,3-dioxygenase-like lactoylglutathione lyase family enzyme